MKHYHPEIFCAALLNAQPMGFYAPAQLVRDAREHGVEVRPVCVNASRWDCTLERRRRKLSPAPPRPAHGEGPLQRSWRADRRGGDGRALRLGRGCLARSGVPAAALEKLADADAFQCARARPAAGAVAGARPRRRAAAAVRRRRGARERARGGADAADRGPRGGRGLSRRPAFAARPSARLPARRSSSGAASSPPPALDAAEGRRQGPCRRHRPGPPAARARAMSPS